MKTGTGGKALGQPAPAFVILVTGHCTAGHGRGEYGH